MEVSDGGERTKEDGIGDSLMFGGRRQKRVASGLAAPPSAEVAELQRRRGKEGAS